MAIDCQRRLVAVLVFLAAAAIVSAQSDAPLHYYDAAIGKTGAPLKAALQSIIRGQTVIPYTATGTDTWDALDVLDEDPLNSANVVLIYSGFTDLKSNQYTGTSGSWDREHLWPQSFGIVARNSNSRAKSDLFNLRPINTSINSSRGNKYYDYSTAPITSYPGGSTADPNSWEPRDPDKGPIARALFYMAVRYDGSDADVPDLELSETPDAATYRFGKLSSLLAWNRQFPVAAPDRQRNQTIYTIYQHNRNPFVDHPDYAEMVFLGVTPEKAWEDSHFTDTELADPQIGSETADPDRDDLGNLLEYALAREPREAEAAPAVTETVTTGAAGESITFSYQHNRNATDVSVVCEWSSDLHTWTTAPTQIISDIITSSETEQITVSLPESANSYFGRVRAFVTMP